MARRCGWWCVVGLMWSLFVGAGTPLQDDLAARRGRVIEKLGPQAMAIFWSAPTRVYSHDVDYEYRQDSDLLYLTGITQDETILVLVPGSAKQAFLFVHEPNPARERILGHVLTKDEVRAQSGIETVYFVREFEPFVTALFNQRAYGARTAFGAASNPTPQGFEPFFDAIRRNTAVLALPLGPRPAPSQPLSAAYEFAAKTRDRFLNVTFTDVSRIVAELRHVKTPYERTVMTRSAEISSEAHLAGMRAAKPGRFEYQVEAAIEHVYLDNGAMSWGYPSVVASGPNATTLHYTASSRQMQDGDLLLVDAAANYQSYTADITRTYPVNGTFTPAQRDIYDIVLDAQTAGLAAAKADRAIRDIDNAANAVLKAGLLRLGLITDPSGDQFRVWALHACCHWIGIDVHDAGDYERRLEPGMTFTVEPGIYIRPDALTHLPDTAANRAFIQKVRPAVEKYQHIGVRIEDSVLLTESGLQNLSGTVPRTIAEIERLMRSARPATPPR
jgi:Xaa-Pro aminopeptidase